MFEPSSIPSGKAMTEAMIDMLLAKEPLFKKNIPSGIIKSAKKVLPFEQIFEMCPGKPKAKKMLGSFCDGRNPNDIHRRLSELLLEGKISSIVTTNYDLCIEKALSEKGWSGKPVVYEDDIDGMGSQVVFKIHGSSADEGRSIVFDLANETTLIKWKQDFLNKLVEDRYLIFIGYSGTDFDICPEIEMNGNIKGVFWCNNSEAIPSENAGFILDSRGDESSWMLVVSDLAELLNRFFGLDIKAAFAPGPIAGFISALESKFSRHELLMWGLNLISVLGYAKVALKCSQELLAHTPESHIMHQSLVFGIAYTHYRMGSYKKSVRRYRQYIKLNPGNKAEKIRAGYDLFESRRSGLYMPSAFLTYFITTVKFAAAKNKLSQNEINVLEKNRLTRKESIFTTIVRYFKFLKKPLKKPKEKIRLKIKDLSEKTEDMGRKTLIGPDQFYGSASSEKAFLRQISKLRQLGEFFPEAVTYRKYLEWKMKVGTLTDSDKNDLRNYRDKCGELGIYPEALKISLLLNDHASCKKYAGKCEYSFYGKIMLQRNWRRSVL